MSNPEIVQVQKVWPPKDPSWKNGRLQLADGRYMNVHKSCLGWFQDGMQCQITYEQGIGRSGKPWTQVTSVNGNLLQEGPAPVAQSMPQQFQQPPVSQQPYVQAPQPQPQNWQATVPAKDPLADLPPILSNVLAHAVGNGVKASDLPEYGIQLAKAIRAFNAAMVVQEPPREMGHGMPADEPPMDDFPPGFVQ